MSSGRFSLDKQTGIATLDLHKDATSGWIKVNAAKGESYLVGIFRMGDSVVVDLYVPDGTKLLGSVIAPEASR